MAFVSQRALQAAVAVLALTPFYSASALSQEATTSGEVRRIDIEAGKITIKHGAISQLQLPAMTLVYKIDPALLKDIKPGDRVSFTARREAGQYVVVSISK
jgi:Cu/Ag efflux protein CusF